MNKKAQPAITKANQETTSNLSKFAMLITSISFVALASHPRIAYASGFFPLRESHNSTPSYPNADFTSATSPATRQDQRLIKHRFMYILARASPSFAPAEPSASKPEPMCVETGFRNFDPESLTRVLTFGDSFSAGTGIYDRGDNYDNKACLREIHSTPGAMIADEFDADSMNFACQNDRIDEVMQQINDADFPTQGQGDLILVTAGGNDLRTRGDRNWSGLIQACLASTYRGCQRPKKHQIRNFATVRARLVDLYTELAARAPDAQIRVLGYPRLFQPSKRRCRTIKLINGKEGRWLDRQSDELNRQVQSAVEQVRRSTGVDIEFLKVDHAFEGHGACQPDRFIKTIRNKLFDSSAIKGSLHPNQRGYNAYYDVVRSHLTTCVPKPSISCACSGSICTCSYQPTNGCTLVHEVWTMSDPTMNHRIRPIARGKIEIDVRGMCHQGPLGIAGLSLQATDTCSRSLKLPGYVEGECSSAGVPWAPGGPATPASTHDIPNME